LGEIGPGGDVISNIASLAGDIVRRQDLYQYILVAAPLMVTIGFALLGWSRGWRRIGALVMAAGVGLGLLLLVGLLHPQTATTVQAGLPPGKHLPSSPPPQRYVTLHGLAPFSVDIPSSFIPDARGEETFQRAISANGDIVEFSSGTLSGDPDAYLARRFEEGYGKICDGSDNFDVGTIYPDPARHKPAGLMLLSWTNKAEKIDYYDLRVAVSTGDTKRWARLLLKVQLPNKTMYSADYIRALKSLRESASVPDRPSWGGDEECPASTSLETDRQAPPSPEPKQSGPSDGNAIPASTSTLPVE
jgi:hypothetical protein